MSDAPELPAAAHKKVGGLSVGMWAAITAGALATAFAMRKKSTPAPAVAGAGAGFLDNTVPTAGNLAGNFVPSNPTATPDAVAPTTNEQWASSAQRFLFALGIDPAAADVAVRHYLNGDPLSVSQQAMISSALIKVGPTPQSVPPPAPGTPDPTGQPVPQLPPKQVIRDNTTGAIYAVDAAGVRTWLHMGDWLKLGSPAPTSSFSSLPIGQGYSELRRDPTTGAIYGNTPNGWAHIGPAEWAILGVDPSTLATTNGPPT